jgi:3-methylcrotonyl-CoA carboxylase alpha subunit
MAIFKKILIANRGEIACRVIKTARRFGIKTVAVHSDADRDALHVKLADEAVGIGPAPSSESYLKADAIVAAALKSGAEAVHPGYGFLSENAEFVEAVEAAGLSFIGPSAKAIRAMGLKDAAKQLMERAKVPVVPGYHGDAQELVILAGKANEIGFPVLIKARAGGGGKGMRRVDRQAEFADALSSAKREARASFGDDRVLVEKYVAKPRHIEIQVFGDSHGNVVHLFERDCSLQRRHQKVIEEAPAPGMTAEMRAAMGEAAVKAAQAIDYVGAGTVEFIVDASEGLRPDRFWFMEMNTRLQVEHPVTEVITGLDLVEWQLRVAAGEPLPKQQDELSIHGWAFEARLYAEDAARNFMPATGTIAHLKFPEASVRVDSGVAAGDAITPFYDPMIAKLIVHGADRAEALSRLQDALVQTEIVGTVTNLDFLHALASHAGFAEGEVDTGLIDRELGELTATPSPSPMARAAAAILASGMQARKSGDPFDDLGPWLLWGAPERDVVLSQAGEQRSLRVAQLGKDRYRVADEDNPPVDLQLIEAGEGVFRLVDGAHAVTIRVVQGSGRIAIIRDHAVAEFTIVDELHAGEDEGAGEDVLRAPMPGVVKQIFKGADAPVEKGDILVVMEAMKMEMTLAAPRAGVIAEIFHREGAQVSEGTMLLRLAEEEKPA